MTIDAQGNLYGTTLYGGGSGLGHGTVFKIATDGVLSTVAAFNGTNGANPYGSLSIDAQGNLYGTAYNGGANSDGTVFKIAAGTGTITTLATFNGTNGNQPYSGVTLDAQGNLYGTTSGGGTYTGGMVFKISYDTGALSTLVNFSGVNGYTPVGDLTFDNQGDLFGTTASGGTGGFGNVFEIAAGTGTLSSIATFNDATSGWSPQGQLAINAQGDLFGTTDEGTGPPYDGNIFELSPAAVPEPASLLALGQATVILGAVLAVRTRRSHRAC